MKIGQTTQFKSGDEAVKNGKKGGQKSVESRRKKADLRKMAQDILTGTYQNADGKKQTGEEMLVDTIVLAMSDPRNKNWGKAIDVLIALTSANKCPEEIAKLKAETEVLKVKAKLLTGVDESGLKKLDAILDELRDNAVNAETE